MKVNNDLTVSSEDLDEFQNIIGVRFNDTKYLIQSLLHSSLFSGDKTKLDKFKNVNNLESDNYEKLEYLGDSVLGLIVAEYFYHDEEIEEYAKAQNRKIEGVLTDIKKILASNESLKPLAEDIKLEKYILYGVLENISDIFDDVIEALIAAIHLDQGYTEANDFVCEFFDIRGALGKIDGLNPKGKLSEICDKNGWNLPEYRLIDEQGPGHKKSFTVGLYVCGGQVSIGTGHKIKDAEADAAEKYLKEMGLKSHNEL
jgi:ribonuclease-3